MGHYNTNLYQSEFDAEQHLYWQERIKTGYDNIEKISNNLDEIRGGLDEFKALIEPEYQEASRAIHTITMNLEHYTDDDSEYATKLSAHMHRYQTVYQQLLEINEYPESTLRDLEKKASAFNKEHHMRELKLHESFLSKFHFEADNPYANENSDLVTALAESLDELQKEVENHREFVMQTELNLHLQNKQFMNLQKQLKELNQAIFYSED